MKKSLIALGVLSALTTAATASEIKIYGKFDLGFSFMNIDHGRNDVDDTTSLSLASGQTAGSRWGFFGEEQLGNGLKVGFRLENGFNTDTGTLGQGGRLFGRQASVHIEGNFGNFKFGRMGALTSGFPDTGLFGGNMSPFAISLGEVGGHRLIYSTEDMGPMDNTITYTSPKFAGGWQVMLQYSSGMDQSLEDGREFESSLDRYMGAALHFDNGGNTEFNLVVDSTNFRSFGPSAYDDPDDSLRITAGLRHGLGFMTLYLGGQYFKDARHFFQEANQFYQVGDQTYLTDKNIAKDGYGLNIGLDYPALGGTFKGQAGWMDAESSDDSSYGLKRWFVSFGWWYDFSKMTTLYTGISYIRDKLDGEKYDSMDTADSITAALGIVHNF